MIKSITVTVLFCIAAGILQSGIISQITFLKVIPDLALCILVFSAYVNGTMPGQISGFMSGLLLDFLSASPLGLNCLVRTLIGALAGVFKGTFFLDIFLMPVILCAVATLIKAVLFFFLHLIFGSHIPVYSFSSSTLWIELGLNCISAPLLFFLLRKIRPIYIRRK